MANTVTDLIPVSTSASSRRHDLDALRAFAMLLGIILHGIMSFIPGIGVIWAVEDSHASPWYGDFENCFGTASIESSFPCCWGY